MARRQPFCSVCGGPVPQYRYVVCSDACMKIREHRRDKSRKSRAKGARSTGSTAKELTDGESVKAVEATSKLHQRCCDCGEPFLGVRCDKCSDAKEKERVTQDDLKSRIAILASRIRYRDIGQPKPDKTAIIEERDALLDELELSHA